MKKILIIASFIVGIAGTAFCQVDPASVLNEAKTKYDQGNYAEAVRLYESLAQEGQANAELWYNLGNAYYRSQAIGKAVLCYERARRIAPRDPDIRANLAFIRQAVKEPDPSFLAGLINSIDSLLSLNELTVMVSATFIIFIFFLILWLFRRNPWILLADAAAFLLVAVLGGWLALKIDQEVATSWAVVLSGPADVRNGPGQDNSVGFTLPEGRKVVVLGDNGEWLAVGLHTEGLKGWIEKKYIEKI